MRNSVSRMAKSAAVLCPFLLAAQSGSLPPELRSSKLARLVPNLFGPNGLELPNPAHDAHFTSAFQSNFGPLNSALAARLTSLPVPSPASGFTYSFDPAIGVYTRNTSTFGPLLAERAETVGKNKFFAGFYLQHFNFRSLDGVSLGDLPAVFEHVQTTPDPNFRKDVITTQNTIDVKLSQWTSFFTFGISSRADVAVAIPLLQATMDVSSRAVVRRVGTAGQDDIHYFLGPSGNRTDTAVYRASGHSSGLGDILVRVKVTAIDGAKAKVALGLEGRMPTGDPYEFLGAGAFGVKPFVAISGSGSRFSPHVNVGYQYNGRSVLAGDVRTGAERLLPRQLNYAAGFESGAAKTFSFSVDIVGQQVFSADRLVQRTFTAANGMAFPQVAFARGNFHTYSVAGGVKVNPVSRLLIAFNLLYQINDGGLRARIVPLIGLSYTL